MTLDFLIKNPVIHIHEKWFLIETNMTWSMVAVAFLKT